MTIHLRTGDIVEHRVTQTQHTVLEAWWTEHGDVLNLTGIDHPVYAEHYGLVQRIPRWAR